MEYRVRMRMLCVLLVAALTLFAPIGRFGNDGIAHANLSPNGWIKLDDSYIYGDEIRVY